MRTTIKKIVNEIEEEKTHKRLERITKLVEKYVTSLNIKNLCRVHATIIPNSNYIMCIPVLVNGYISDERKVIIEDDIEKLFHTRIDLYPINAKSPDDFACQPKKISNKE
jgi:adenylate kinase